MFANTNIKAHRIQCSELPKYTAYRIKQVDEQIQNLELGNCFLMNLLSLAVPTWEKVSCNLPLVQQVFCHIENKAMNPDSLQVNPDKKAWIKGYILYNNTCYSFTWHKLGTNMLETCASKRFNAFPYSAVSILFNAVSDIFPPIFTPELEHIVTYKKYWNTFSYKLDKADKENAGIYICAGHQSEYLISDNAVMEIMFHTYLSVMEKRTVQVSCQVMK